VGFGNRPLPRRPNHLSDKDTEPASSKSKHLFAQVGAVISGEEFWLLEHLAMKADGGADSDDLKLLQSLSGSGDGLRPVRTMNDQLGE
jgi:hypothetical protein